MNDSVSMRDEVIHADAEAKSHNEETKTLLKNIISETKSLYILLVFLLVTVALLIAVCIYHYLIKYKAKQKHSLPFYVIFNK